MIACALIVWAGVTFLPAYFAKSLNFHFLGWPFAFWMGAYGAPVAYLFIVVGYAVCTHGIERAARRKAQRKS